MTGVRRRRPVVWTDRAKMIATVLCTGAAAWLVSALALMLGPGGVR